MTVNGVGGWGSAKKKYLRAKIRGNKVLKRNRGGPAKSKYLLCDFSKVGTEPEGARL